MADFIVVHTVPDGPDFPSKQIIVNVAHIRTVQEFDGYTSISLTERRKLRVRDSLDSVYDRLRRIQFGGQ